MSTNAPHPPPKADDICVACGRLHEGVCPHPDPSQCPGHQRIAGKLEADRQAEEARQQEIIDRLRANRERRAAEAGGHAGPALTPVPFVLTPSGNWPLPPAPTQPSEPPKDSPWPFKAGVYVLEKHGVPLFFTVLTICWMALQANWERQDRLQFAKTLESMAASMNALATTINNQARDISELRQDVRQLQGSIDSHNAATYRGGEDDQARQPSRRRQP